MQYAAIFFNCFLWFLASALTTFELKSGIMSTFDYVFQNVVFGSNSDGCACWCSKYTLNWAIEQ